MTRARAPCPGLRPEELGVNVNWLVAPLTTRSKVGYLGGKSGILLTVLILELLLLGDLGTVACLYI